MKTTPHFSLLGALLVIMSWSVLLASVFSYPHGVRGEGPSVQGNQPDARELSLDNPIQRRDSYGFAGFDILDHITDTLDKKGKPEQGSKSPGKRSEVV